MEKDTALAVFTALEQQRSSDDDPLSEYKPPTFDVRLDATTNAVHSGLRRSWRLRVTVAKGWFVETDEWLYVFDVAREHGLSVDVQNAGLELS